MPSGFLKWVTKDQNRETNMLCTTSFAKHFRKEEFKTEIKEKLKTGI